MLPYDDFRCPCCDRQGLSVEFYRDLCNLHTFLEMIHGEGDVQAELESGCRCWNKHVSIYENIPNYSMDEIPKRSLHLIEDEDGNRMDCLASDIRFKAMGEVIKPLRIACILQHHLIPLGASRIRGIGPMRTSIHLDSRDQFKPVTWVRGEDGRYVYGVDFGVEAKK